MQKALINKLLLILYSRIKKQHLVCILPTSSPLVMLLSLWCLYCLAFALCCMPWKQTVPCVKLVATSLLSICRALSLSLFLPLKLCDSLPSAVTILPICSFTYLLFFLALGWWQSGIWVVCLLFHDMLCCVTAAAWSLSLPLPPPSPPWKPTDFNVRVCLRSPNF